MLMNCFQDLTEANFESGGSGKSWIGCSYSFVTMLLISYLNLETPPVFDIKSKGKRAQSDTMQSEPENKRARTVCDGSESRVS